MNKYKNNKKGFTIVELVIVIAVIAILSAVLIPTFSGLIKKANVTADQTLVRNLNTSLAIASDGSNGKSTMYETLNDLKDQGYDITKLSPTSAGSDIVWDSNKNQFVLVMQNGEYYTGTTYEDYSESDYYKLWKIYTNTDVSNSKYSVYLSNTDLTGEVTVNGVGFDAGENTGISKVTYNGADSKDVVLRTNGGELVVNAENDNVSHYGASDYTNIVAVKNESFHEFGVSAFVRIEKGHFVAEETAKVVNLNVASNSVTVTEQTGSNVVSYSKSSESVSVIVNGQTKEVSDVKTEEQVKEEAKNSEVVAEGGVAEVNGVKVKTLQSAYDLARENETITLISDILVTDEICISKNLTIDFNGYVVTGENSGYGSVFGVYEGATAKFTDSSVLKTGKIIASDYGISAEANATGIIEVSINSEYACLTGNNTTGNMNFVINSGVLTSESSETIYMPSQGTLTITGGILNGGISMRMGKLTMTGGEINGMTSKQVSDPINEYWNYSGSAWIGDAIYVRSGAYSGEPNNNCEINITGGTINGNAHRAVCVYDIGTNCNQVVRIKISENVTINGLVTIDRNFTESSKYNRTYPADVEIVTPTETIK